MIGGPQPMLGDELQVAQFAALTQASICAGRIYDNPPEQAVFPYVTIGDEQVVDDSTSCGAAWEVFADAHLWSRTSSGSKREVKALIADVVPVLAVPLTLPGFRIVEAHLQNTRTFRDPDGLTEHSVLTFRYLIDPA